MAVYIVVFIAWSLLMVCLGIHFNSKLDESYIEQLEKSRDFQKDQKEVIAETAREIVKENQVLRHNNIQLIDENKKFKKELAKQSNTTYNIFY